VFVAGVTTTVAPVKDPGIHVYVEAPLPVRVKDVPAHTVEEDAEAFTVGLGFTNSCTVLVLAQLPFDPVTV
jgi:hypothetical protein